MVNARTGRNVTVDNDQIEVQHLQPVNKKWKEMKLV
jgi:hypothetical protein